MLRSGGFVRRCLRCGAFGLAAVMAVAAIASDADARGRRHRSSGGGEETYNPPYASIVVDVNSGVVMQATEADSPRHPASLTKVMTLFLLFEQIEAGKIKMSTEFPASARAAAQAPSKLGLKPGETIKVETAIRSIVTKSANDVAVVVAEALGGDEINFAKLMNAKARALGMKHTTYQNASGLPDEKQITTALKAKLDRLRATCEYRNNADTVPTADSLAPAAAEAEPGKIAKSPATATWNVLAEDYWDLYTLLLR